ncbi:MAG: xanthine dehydrogenase accessory protein XdhC [Rhodobacteraceae bacterium]|nr:xanthine dehydrogenase accessory protein XdhC [Paracoccaceae bacterium]
MSFDLQALRARLQAQGPVVRVVVAGVAGSAPREAGASMLVWAEGQEGTIGGGALEFTAITQARAMLAQGRTARLDRLPLGPVMGQCCGGAVVLLSEIWDEARLNELGETDVVARPLPGSGPQMPLAVARMLKRARGQGALPAQRMMQGWMVEPVARPTRMLWIWGAGHVGRALVLVLAPLPDLRITWLDTDAARFPPVPEGVIQRIASNPADLVDEAPDKADHLVLTFSHALDLELCHRLLTHGFGSLGLIGSDTKRARFRSRLAALGHRPEQIARIVCPIGDPGLGKHPQAIAVGVAATILNQQSAGQIEKERAG